MAKTDCVSVLLDPEVQKRLFGDKKVPEEAIKRMAQDVEWLRENAAKDPSLGSYQSRVNSYIKDQKVQSEVEKAIYVNDKRVMRNLKQYALQDAFAEDPAEAIISKISGSTRLANGGRDSAFGRITAINNEHINALNAGLERDGVLELAQSGQLDHPVRDAWQALNSGEGMPDVSKEAKQIAETLHKVYRSLFITTREAGIPVRDLPGYCGPILDDIKKLRGTTFEEWSAGVRAFGIDREKTFGVDAGNAARENEILKGIFEGKKWGKMSSDSAMPDLSEEVREGVSYSKKLSATRALRFTNAEAESKYMDAYGRGNLLETLTYDIGRKSKLIGASQVFGSNPEKMINEWQARLKTEYAKAGRDDLVQKLSNAQSQINANVNEMTSKTNIPGLSTMTDITNKIKAAQSLSKLGWAGVNSIPNLAVSAMQLRTMTGDSMLGSMANIGFEWLKQLPAETRKETARQAGYLLDDFNMGMFGDADTWTKPGLGSRMMQLQFKLNGMNAVNSMQNAFAKLYMQAVGENSSKAWADVPTQFKAGLMNAGIQEKDWAHLSRASEQMPDGRQMVTVDGIRGLDPASVGDRASEVGLTNSRYINDLSYKYYSALIHGGTDSTTSSTFREKAATSFGQNKGTWQRNVLDLAFQFKQFYFQAANIAIKTLNMAPDEAKLARGVLQSGQKQYGEFGKLLVGTTAMGYLAMLLKEGVTDLAEGAWSKATGVQAFSQHRTVDPTKVQTWIDAMNRGGAAGIYMDAMLGENNKFAAAEALAGPTFGQLYNKGTEVVADLRDNAVSSAQRYIDTGEFQDPHQGLNGKSKQVIRDVGMMVKQNVPFGQFPIVKQALDYGFYNVLQDSLTPGYVQRRQLRYQREQQKQGLGR